MRRLPGPLRFARMAGSSIASPSAAGWVTDFVNAAYYARPDDERSVADLRLAHGIIATRWAQLDGRRLGASDALMVNRAYGRLRLRDRGRLTGAALLQGAQVLIGEWFAEAWTDPGRRAYGIAFPTVADRSGGLLGQTFEIEVVAEAARRAPIATRGYVTCTTALTVAEGDALTTAADLLEQRYASGAGVSAPAMLPHGAELLALIILTTHEGHFLGPALSHLLVWSDRDGAWIRDVGAWDPLAAHLAAAYRAAGRTAQQEFWGPSPPQRSMLAQLAAVTG